MTARRRSTAVNFTAAIRYAREWDVPVLLHSDGILVAAEVTHSGPVTGGIHWPTRTIIWSVDDLERFDIAPFIHELSHVLADEDPATVSESDSSILAMDHAAHCFLGTRDLWRDWMQNFVTDRGEWWAVAASYRDDMLLSSQLRAQRDGLLTREWTPSFKRARGEASRAA